MKPKLQTSIAALAAVLALGGAVAANAGVIVPEGDAGTALRLNDQSRATGRISGLGNVHGLAVAPRRGVLIAGSLDEVSRDDIAKPKGVSQQDHNAHHGGAKKGAMKAGSMNTGATPANPSGDISLVSLVDLNSGEILRQIEVPGMVHHVSVDSGERWAVVTHPSLDAVSVIDLETGAVTATVVTGANPNYTVFNPTDGLFYVSNAGDNNILPLDPVTGATGTPIATPGGVEHMVIDVASQRIWGAEADTGQVDEVDLATGKVVRRLDVGGTLHGIARDAGTGTIYVSAREQGKIAVIEPATGAIDLAAAGPEPYHLEVDGDRLIVSSAENDVLWAFRLSDLSRVAEVATRGRGHQMVVLHP